MDFVLTNWKTSLAGIGLIVLGILDFFGYGPNPGQGIAELTAGIGMLFAKDGNVSGVK